MHILSKIAKNKEADTVDERDKKDLAKYLSIIEEYNSKRLADEQKTKPTVLVIEHLLESKGNTRDPYTALIPLRWSVGGCSDAWEGVKLKVIPYDEIPRRPISRIWLAKIRIPMDDRVVIKEEKPQPIFSAPYKRRVSGIAEKGSL